MALENMPITWKLEPTHWSDLSAPDRVRYAEIVASYGGGAQQTARFRRYRAAELCAYSIRSVLGLETTIGLVVSQGI